MKIKLYIYTFSTAVLLASCSKDELIKFPSEVASLEQIKEATDINKDTQSFNVSGLYSVMLNTGTGGTTRANDFGQKGYDIFSDMISGDMVLGATIYGWYSSLSQLNDTVDFTNTSNYIVWRYYYRVIFAANGIIDALGGNDATDLDQTGKYYMGQAKAMRAYGYFYLLNFYSKDFNPNEKILPLYTTTADTNLEQVENQKIFDKIVEDLTQAVDYLNGFERPALSFMNKYVAEGLLAYTYAASGDYENAKNAAKDIIDNGNFVLSSKTDVTNGFNNVKTPGWMWGADITTQTDLDLISWWGQADIYTYSYAFVGDYKPIDESLYNKIKPNDIRKTQFSTVVSGSSTFKLVAANKFYDSNKKIGGQRTITSDYVYMRVVEFYLLYAESLAKTGDDNGAKDALKKVLENRFDNTSDYSYVDALSGQGLQDEIYLQTRIELWGEGKSYLALKRNKGTVVRGSNHLSLQGVSIPYNDPRLTFEVPQLEIQNNPNIDKKN